MFYFRVDANETVATGHVMRCMAIAKCMEELGEKCTFITADHKADKLISSNGFRIICLNSEWNVLEAELTALKELIQKEKIEKLFVDSYYATEFYISELNKNCHVYLMDDYGIQIYDTYCLINYNIYADSLSYPSRYQGSDVKLLCGCPYVPLRKEFSHITSRPIRTSVKDVLITTGGADEFNVAYSLLEYIMEKHLFENITFHVICGSMNRNLNSLFEIEKQSSQVKLYQNVLKVSELMLHCDIGITAGGVTMYELCACGLPGICICTADNQKMATEAFADRKLMQYAGDVRDDMDGLSQCIRNICSYIKKLKDNPMLRSELSSRMMEMIDGKGAMNLACELKS